MRDRCPYCGMQNVASSRIDGYTGQEVRDIREHACFGWEPKPVLPSEPTDTSFLREARNTEDGLRRWREQNR